MSEWQPIETAPPPRDLSGDYAFLLVWNGKEVIPAAHEREGSFADITAPDRDGEWLDVYPAPTHWMPLPAPPNT